MNIGYYQYWYFLTKATGRVKRARQAQSGLVFPERISSPCLGAAQALQV